MEIIASYAGVFGLVFLLLSVRTLRLRRRLGIAVGDRSNELMLRAMRVHANFAEYVPLTLLLLVLAEGRGAAAWALHVACVALLAGRVSHAIGVSRVDERLIFRIVGMALTFLALGGASIYLLSGALS
jgi:uncharacterized membrane protein YecN with MAPEG domain